MRFRKPCEHDRYERHSFDSQIQEYQTCPGGEFLPEDALVIEKVTIGREELAAALAHHEALTNYLPESTLRPMKDRATVLAAALLVLNAFDAITVQKGAPE